MPAYLQVIFAVTMIVGLSMCILLFYFKNEEASNRLFGRIGKGVMFLLHKVGGANWRTTFTALGTALGGVLTILSILPDQLGPIAEIIPTPYKVTLIKVSLAATALLHILNGVFQKDKSVTGGATTQDRLGNVAAIQPPVPAPPNPAIPAASAPIAAPPQAG